MKEPKVELKKVKNFIGRDGHGLNAELWINGIFCYFVLDEGCGGMMDFTSAKHMTNDPAKKKAIEENCKLLDDYIKTLPDETYEFHGRTTTIKMDLEFFVNKLCDEIESQKLKKKMEKHMLNAIVFGVPNGNSYQMIKYKIPLAELVKTHKAHLQKRVMEIQVNECKNGVQILNTNLTALGIQI